MKINFASFTERADRTRYIYEQYMDYLKDSVLDVGCDNALLRDFIGDVKYTGIDIGGSPDIKIDLEDTERLPFDDNSFHCVICSDVLEHLDNLHMMADELVRVTKKYTIISLPNCWGAARIPIERGRGSFLHYGLPDVRPADRHKWFFSVSEARSFMENFAQRHSLTIRDMHVTDKPRSGLLKLLRRIRYPKQDRYLNRYAHTVWAVFEKN